LAADLADSLSSLPGIGAATTGPIEVTNIEEPSFAEAGSPAVPLPTPAPAPAEVHLGIQSDDDFTPEEHSTRWREKLPLLIILGLCVLVLTCCAVGSCSKKQVVTYERRDFLSGMPEPATGDTALDDPSAPMMSDVIAMRGP
jgi:hypothetical protein